MVKEFFNKYLESTDSLMNVTIEITSLCNLKCGHCYVDDRQNKSRCEYLNFESIKKIVDEALKLNAITITITGGEPLTHPNFIDIIKYIKQKGFIVFLKTNGTLITEKNISDIKMYVDFVYITKYGCSEQVYEETTQSAGSYSKYMQAKNLLQQHKVPYQENAVLLKDNESELETLLNTTSLMDVHITANCDAPYAIQHRPSDAALLDYYRSKRPELLLGKYDGIDVETPVCNCGTRSLTVNAAGEINPCTNFYYSLGNCRDCSLEDVWFSIKRETLVEKCRFKNFAKCLNCPDRKYLLTVSPCNNYAETGDMNAISNEMCRHCLLLKQVCEAV